MFSVIPWYLFLDSNSCNADITYKVTLWRFPVTIVAIETQQLFLCIVVDPRTCNCQQNKTIQCCHGKATMNFFAALSSYKIFQTTFKKIKVLRSLRKVPDFLSDFCQIWNFSTDFHKSFQYQIS
jgi:hypothetical protein